MRSKELALVAAGAAAGWALAGRGAETPVRAAPDAAGNDTVMVAPLVGGDGIAVVVLDSTHRTFAVYHHDARKGKLKLSAVRRYAGDMQLTEYNNEAPSVGEIERLTKSR